MRSGAGHSARSLDSMSIIEIEPLYRSVGSIHHEDAKNTKEIVGANGCSPSELSRVTA